MPTPTSTPKFKWGHRIEVGTRVTSQGRHGTGQPMVTGDVIDTGRGWAIVNVDLMDSDKYFLARPFPVHVYRTLRNLRRAD